MNNTLYYIAYGSNLNLQQMAIRCPTAKAVGTGVIKNYQLIFAQYATLIKRNEAETPIAVWEIDADCEKKLDYYEGFPIFYRKEYLEVEVNGHKITGMIYLMNNPLFCRPDPAYFRIVLEGYHDVGFDPEYLYNAYRYSCKQMNSGMLFPIVNQE